MGFFKNKSAEKRTDKVLEAFSNIVQEATELKIQTAEEKLNVKCEMCGGTLNKDGILFVCQECGETFKADRQQKENEPKFYMTINLSLKYLGGNAMVGGIVEKGELRTNDTVLFTSVLGKYEVVKIDSGNKTVPQATAGMQIAAIIRDVNHKDIKKGSAMIK